LHKSPDVPRIDAGPATVHWGFFDAKLPPILTIGSGDRVTISSVSGSPEMLPPPPFKIPPALPAIHAANGPQQFFGHMCTGPVAVRGAKAGQVLQVDIETIDLHYDWGYNVIRPLAGAFPDDFPEYRPIYITLDQARMTGRLPWGQDIPLRPFFGVMAVAPGTILYLPIFTDGALFSVGDGHGAQGDGEVCVTAIETGLVGTFRLTVRDDMRLEWPLAETPTHMITMAFDPDLDDGVVIALRQMIDLICARTGLDRYQAYALSSLAADLRVTQVVNGSKGIHVMLDKRYLKR
jgi:acetamidase/formamidase